MKSKEPSQDIDDILLDEKSADFDADDLFDLETNENSDITASGRNTHTVTNTAENKAIIPYIISESKSPYFPYQYEAPLIGIVKEIYIDKLDYMVGMVEFRSIFKELGIGSVNSSNDIDRINSIYKILDVDVMEAIRILSDDVVTNIGNYTNRVESSSSSKIGFDTYVIKHLQHVHIDEILKDVEDNIIHRFIQLNYQKKNLIIHLYPNKCMELKGMNYEEALSYCISAMWATLINLVGMQAGYDNDDEDSPIVALLKQVFHKFNPIVTKMVVCSQRALTPEGYSFIQEMRQLSEANKHLTGKAPLNRVIFRWTPKSDRFEDYIHGFRRIRFDRTDDIDDVRGDSNGKRGCTYDCKIKKKKLTTTITIVGQNIVRDVTGNYTKQIYSTLSDIDTLKHFELGILFTILTGTKEHNDLFQKALSKSYQDIKTGMVKFMKEDVPSEIDGYTENMVVLAVERLKKYVFKDVVPNNDYYVATQLVEHFNMKRNVPKDLMTVFRMYKLEGEELENALQMIERHKREKIREMIEYAKTLVKEQRCILHELYNYLYREGFRL